MAVVIEKRPIGVVLNTGVSANINQDYSSAFATVNSTAHGLSDGNYIYIKSNVENYNGFWRIDVRNANEFLLIDNPYVAWIVDADITYYPQIITHGWSCAHLPIVYELSNTRYPTNTVDTARTITSISNDNGYANLNLSGSLGTFEDLAFVKISNAPNSDFNGVYQIIDKLATNDVTINALFESVTASGLVGSSIQLYYSSYNIVVRVYAGLNASHEWADQKPYELAATLELIPDEDNRVKFSINDILKAYVQTKNNLLLPSLPLNTDAFTQFYIEVAEQYDTSNGYTITTFEGPFASDQSTFEGYAANSMLAFKNIHSGYLSEYVMINNTAKFLTLFSTLVLFEGCYQDVSFIIPDITEFDISNNNGSAYQTTSSSGTEADWTPSTASTLMDTSNPIATEILYIRSNLAEGVKYRFAFTVTGIGTYTSGGGNALSVFVSFYDASFSSVGVPVTLLSATGSTKSSSGFAEIEVPSSAIYIGFRGSAATISSGSYAIQINTFEYSPSQIIVRENSVNTTIQYLGPGIYRYELTDKGADEYEVSIHNYSTDTGQISESKDLIVSTECSNQEICLSWQNNLGGFDYWKFTGETDHVIDITAAGETRENIFPSWPNSYGENADTIRKQTFRESANRKFVFSQFLTQDQANAIAYIKSSPLVQIVNSRQDRRTVIVDTDSFSKFADGAKTFQISFNILYTDDIPSQRV